MTIYVASLFLRESWSWSSFSSSSGADFQRTMAICVASLLGGGLGHDHRPFLSLGSRTRPPPSGVKSPKSGKEGLGVKKTPISPHRKGHFESKNSHFHCGFQGLFGSEPFLGWLEMGVFDSETLLFRFWGILAPVEGGRVRNPRGGNFWDFF